MGSEMCIRDRGKEGKVLDTMDICVTLVLRDPNRTPLVRNRQPPYSSIEVPEPRLLRWGGEVREERISGVRPTALHPVRLKDMWEELRNARGRLGWRSTKGYEFECFNKSLEEQMSGIVRRQPKDREAIRSAVLDPDGPVDEESAVSYTHLTLPTIYSV